MTVGDMARAIEGARRGWKDAIEFMSAFGDHPDVHWLVPPEDENGGLWMDDPRNIAECRDAVRPHERTSCDDAEWRRTSTGCFTDTRAVCDVIFLQERRETWRVDEGG